MRNIENKILRLGITHGDVNGIGYELILKTFAEQEILELVTPIVYGSLKAASVYEKLLNSACRWNVIKSVEEARPGRLNIIDICDNDIDVTPGTRTAASSAATSRALGRAMNDYVSGLFDALVLGPSVDTDISSIIEISKQMPEVQSHTLMPISIYGNETIRVASVSGKVVEEMARKVVSEEDIVERGTALRNALRRDMRIDNPRIAIVSFESKDKDAAKQFDGTVIAPAITRLNEAGIPSFGPYDVKTIFEDGEYCHFDGILGMFDDQVLNPFTEMFGDVAVHHISGLPLVITSPVQGPSFEVAGKCVSDETSMRNALYAAIDTVRSRYYYDLPFAHPLPKLYREHREDGDKARFSVRKPFPKRGELPELPQKSE